MTIDISLGDRVQVNTQKSTLHGETGTVIAVTCFTATVVLHRGGEVEVPGSWLESDQKR